MDEHDRVACDWYRSAFDVLYPVVYAHRTAEAAAAEVAYAVRALELRPEESVLDLACGAGRHLAHLMPAARLAVGLDYSDALLACARAALGSGARLVRADMRAIPFREAFDGLTNFFTSFGYFFTDEENQKTVDGVAGALRPGGRFFIDYLNRAHVEATLVPRSRRRIGDYDIAEERWIDAATVRINKTTVIERNGETVERQQESVRMYSLDDVTAMLGRAGLTLDRVSGDFTGQDYGQDSPRMILIGHKDDRYA